MNTRNSLNSGNITTQNVGVGVNTARAASRSSSRANGRKRRSPGHDPVKHSGKSMHRYEQLQRSQEKLILSIGIGFLIGGAVGYSLGGYYPLTIGTGLSLGLAVGILNAS